MTFIFFWFCLTLTVLKKLKNLIFEIPLIPQTVFFNYLFFSFYKTFYNNADTNTILAINKNSLHKNTEL